MNSGPNIDPGVSSPTPGQQSWPTPPAYPPQPGSAAAPSPKRRRVLVVVLILAAIAIVVLGGFLLFRGQSGPDVLTLGPGDCFDQPPSGNNTNDVQRRPCDEPHDAEVIGTMSHPAQPGASYPTVPELRTFMSSACVAAFASYTGANYDSESGLDFGLFYPLPGAWSSGGRNVRCYVSRVDGTKMTGSIRNAGASAAPTPTP